VKGIQNLRLDANVYTTVTKTYGEIYVSGQENNTKHTSTQNKRVYSLQLMGKENFQTAT
jgi:hypothetical protein